MSLYYHSSMTTLSHRYRCFLLLDRLPKLENLVYDTIDHRTAVQSAEAVEYTDCISAEEYDPTPNECPDMTKQSDGEAPVMLGLWGMRSTSIGSSLQGPLWCRVFTPDRVLSTGHFSRVQTNYYDKLNC